MKVVTAAGATIDLGITETTPTISITDFSRRETDDFGVTTVVQRGFSRRLSVRLAVPFDTVDNLQRQLADLRATAALWVADDRYAWLGVRGFYKDFELDLAVPPVSYCTLTVEGLAETETAADPGGDPAPAGLSSTLRLLQPVVIGDAQLLASSVAEGDAPAWAASTSYAKGARVTVAHRIYESLIEANVGKTPADSATAWLLVGPTNRWAMFDQALGTTTTADRQVAVTVQPGQANAIALLDVAGATVRVQADGYDRTQAVSVGPITFLDLPPGTAKATVTIAGPAAVSVGTLLVGNVVALGSTEAAPTAGITDFSRKTVDQFGEVTVVKRAWAKRMAARAMIDTAAIDVVANRIAAVRARPSLWIGQEGLDSLCLYGFFKDFSIEVGEKVSKLSLSIEGLSEAAKLEPIKGTVNWPDVGDPNGTKPKNNADKTSENKSKDTDAVGGRPAGQVTTAIDANEAAIVAARKEIETARASLSSDIAVARDETAKVRSDLSTAVSDVSASAATARSEAASARQAASTVASDLSSEIARAKDQEGTLLTKTQQAQGRADAAYSATTDEAVNRAAADSAIAGRVASTEAQLRGDQDSVIAGRIRDEAATRANQDSAIAGRVATTEAGLSQRAPTWMVKSYGNAASLPAGFGDAGIYRPDGSRAALAGRSYTVAWFDLGGSDIADHKRFDVYGGGEQKYNGPNASDNDAAAMARYIQSIPGGRSVVVFTTDEPASNRLTPSLLQAMQSIGAGIRYESSSFKFHAAYVLFGRTGVGRGNGKEHYLGNFDQDPAAFLELPFTASGGRIQLGDQSGLTVIQASVTDEAATRANQDSAIAGRVSSTEAQLNGSQDSVIAARIRDEAASRASQDSAIAGRVASTEAQLNGSQDSVIAARIRDEATTRANQDSAIAGRVALTEARAGGAGNLLSNSAFAGSSYAGWTPYGPMAGYSVNEAGDNWRPSGENVLGHYSTTDIGAKGMGSGGGWYGDPVPVTAGRFYQFYAFLAAHRAIAVELMLEFLNADNQVIQTLYSGGLQVSSGGRTASNWSQHGWMAVEAPGGAAAVRFTLSKWGTVQGETNSYFWFWRPYVGEARQGQSEWNPYSPASGRTTTDVAFARISDEASTRAAQDSSIAGRVSSTEAQLNGSQDSVIAARIRDEAAARANQDSAIAGRVSSTEANYGKLNDSVNGAIFPGFERKFDGWGSDTSWSGRNSDISWENGPQGAGLGFQAPGGGNHWLYMNAPDRLIRAVKGRKYRAGFWIVQWGAPNGYGGNPRVYWESFNQDKSGGEFLGYSANAPEATRSYYAAIPDSAFYCYASDIYVDWDQGAYPNRVWLRPRINVDNMPGGSGYQISGWFFREITDDVRTNARVTDEATTRANQDSAIAGRVASTEAQLNGSQDSVIAGRIRDEAAARANQDSAIAGRVSTTEAKITRTPDLFRVQARGNGAQNVPVSGSLLVSPFGAQWSGGRSYMVAVFYANSNSVQSVETFDIYGNDDDRARMADRLNGIGYEQTVIIATNDEPANGRFGRGLDTAMARVGAGEAFFASTFKLHSAYILVGRGGAGRGGGVEFYKGGSDTAPDSFLDEYIPLMSNGRPALGSNGGVTQIRAALSDEAAARANQDSALSSRVSSTEARAGALEGRVQSSEGAIADVRNKVATAWAEKTVSVPGAAATVRMIATDANGNPTSNVAFLADVIALINTVNGQPIAALKAEGGNVLIANDLRGGKGRVIMDNGSVMKVMGTGFGSSNQFIEWFGPRQDNLANCTESNASYYLKTDGSSYFGGSLSAGTIKNAIGTTSTASNASVTTGTVGSRGGSRVVVLSYSWAWYQRVDKPQSEASGNDLSAQIILSRNGADVATLNATGSWDRDPAHSSDEPGNYREAIGGSLTFTDNSGGSSVEYSARLVTRNTGPGPQNGSNRPGEATQRISIVQTEQ